MPYNSDAAPPYFILTDEYFTYLQTHSVYPKYVYYGNYKEYSSIVSLITSIPGVTLNNGATVYSEFLKMLESKRQFVIS